MPNAAVAAEIHQPLDIHRRLAAQIAFDRELRDEIPKLADLGLGQILDARRRIDPRGLAGGERTAAPDPVNVRQRDRDVLVDRDIDSRNTCHRAPLNPVAACGADPSRSPERRLCGGRSCSSGRSGVPKLSLSSHQLPASPLLEAGFQLALGPYPLKLAFFSRPSY